MSQVKKDPNVLLARMEYQRKTNSRPFPSEKLITNGNLLEPNIRAGLLNVCAKLTDNNWCGRSEMCIYFACLLRYSLKLLGHKAEVHVGDATYYGVMGTSFTWEHSWVVCGEILIDGNVDSMIENPYVPVGIDPNPYWGILSQIPSDRTFSLKRTIKILDEEFELDDDYLEWKRRLKEFMKINDLLK
ncbi:hypothetical protein [Paenibacillus sp. HJGM_3]|uniref:hypothetical protein n=1 Tax=Paenibacillus sp. HJGM_3 TaxID=3379816 RepID=UPI00385A38D6